VDFIVFVLTGLFKKNLDGFFGWVPLHQPCSECLEKSIIPCPYLISNMQ